MHFYPILWENMIMFIGEIKLGEMEIDYGSSTALTTHMSPNCNVISLLFRMVGGYSIISEAI